MSELLTPIKVLYVEDDERLGRLTLTYLQHHGLQISWAKRAAEALELMSGMVPDVILLDVMLPDMDGRQLCANLRREYDGPILMISALDEEADRVYGLEGGADDYISKPFSSRELLARIRAQVRRSRGQLNSASQRLERGPLFIDLATRVASFDGRELGLTSQEFSLLYALAQRAGRVLSREQLISMTHQHDDEVFERAIDVQISRLRQKLGDDSRQPAIIKTVRGVGYMLSLGGS